MSVDMEKPPFDPQNPWLELRRLTPARIALGRTGTSLPTRAQLDFQFAHAQARRGALCRLIMSASASNWPNAGATACCCIAPQRIATVISQRPDLGRKLSEESVKKLRDYAAAHPGGVDLAIVVADGLSALAVHRHTLPFLARFAEQSSADGWSMAPVVLVEQGRVAVADEIGELLGAKMTVILIGERPAWSSPDSLGLYFTYNPKVGLTDAYRNCISNVRLEGLTYGMAAHRLLYLMREACRRQLSGVNLKDERRCKRWSQTQERTLKEISYWIRRKPEPLPHCTFHSFSGRIDARLPVGSLCRQST